MNYQEKLNDAALCYLARKKRHDHPSGRFDNAGRWYPNNSEEQSCCKYIRSPSRAYPHSYMVHCRTIQHVANLHQVSLNDLKAAVRKLDPPKRAKREGGDTYYKAVAVLPDGKENTP